MESVGLPRLYASVQGHDWPGRPSAQATSGLIRNLVEAFDLWVGLREGGALVDEISTVDRRNRVRHFGSAGEEQLARIEQQIIGGEVQACFLNVKSTPDSVRGEFYFRGFLSPGGGPVPVPGGGGKVKPQPPTAMFELWRRDPDTRAARSSDDFELIELAIRNTARVFAPKRAWGHFGLGESPPLAGHIPMNDSVRYWDQSGTLFGYDWVELLTPEAIKGLSRCGRDLTLIPAESVTEIPFADGRNGLLAAIRVSPYSVSDDDMRRFRDFVLPILFVSGPPQPGSAADRRIDSSGGWDRSRPFGVLPEDWFPEDDRSHS